MLVDLVVGAVIAFDTTASRRSTSRSATSPSTASSRSTPCIATFTATGAASPRATTRRSARSPRSVTPPRQRTGTIELAFTVEPGGHVTHATATGLDADVASCIVDLVNGLKLPEPSHGAPATVKAELELHPPK